MGEDWCRRGELQRPNLELASIAVLQICSLCRGLTVRKTRILLPSIVVMQELFAYFLQCLSYVKLCQFNKP